MRGLLRYLFVVQHDYRDPAQAARASVVLPIISILTLLALILGVLVSAAAVTGSVLHGDTLTVGSLITPLLILWTGAALWLTQKGYIRAATASIGLLLGIISFASLYVDGIAPSPILVSAVLLTFMGLVYGVRGIVLALVLIWIGLPAAAYLQSKGSLNAEIASLSSLMRQALISVQLLTLAAFLLGLFSWNLRRSLARTAQIIAQTRSTAATGQAISRILHMDELLTSAVDLIRDRFAFYHVQIFLVDETRSYANLAASTGQTGQALMAQGFRVPVGPRTAAGEAISTNELSYIRDITKTAYRQPDLLAQTRSELVIPLAVGDEVVGALDIQSTRPNALDDQDIEAMRILANQIGQSIQNARLFENQQRSLLQNRRLFLESETNLREIERLNRQLIGQAWQEYLLEHNLEYFGTKLKGEDMQSGTVDWTPAMRQAIERQHLVNYEEKGQYVLSVPITSRGQSIGAIEVRLPGEPANRSEARSILQAVTERMAFSLENARLFEQARIATEREQQINTITARLQGLTSVDDILSTAVSALSLVLNAEQAAIRLVGRNLAAAAEERSETGSGNGQLPPKTPEDRATIETTLPPASDQD